MNLNDPVVMGQTVCFFERQDRGLSDPLVVLTTFVHTPTPQDNVWRIDGYAFPRRGFPYAVTKAPLSEIREPGCAILWQDFYDPATPAAETTTPEPEILTIPANDPDLADAADALSVDAKAG